MLRSYSAWCCLPLATHLLPAGLLRSELEGAHHQRHAAAKQDRQAKRLCTNADKCTQTPKNYSEKKYKAVWALRLTDMSKDYVTLLSLNLLLCLHLLNISERLLMLVRKSAFKIANFSSKHRLQDLAPLE